MYSEQFDINRPLNDNPDHASDILAINDLWRTITFGKEPIDTGVAPDPEQLQFFMSDFDHLVIRNDTARIIAAIGTFESRGGLAKIDSLAVAPEYRRQGHARTLATSAINHCIDQGKTEIITHALPASQPLFQSLGFEEFEINTQGAATMFLDLSDR